MLFTENNGQQMWSQMLTEKFNVTDQYQLNWVSEYAAFHEIYESSLGLGGAASIASPIPSNGVGPMYSTPLNTTGIGNPLAPGYNQAGQVAQGGSADFFHQAVGSGDVPISTLPMSLNIALLTVGLELLPVQNAKGPWALLSYMDFPYAGGKLGRSNEVVGLNGLDGRGVGAENKPLYFKVVIDTADIPAARAYFKERDVVTFTNGTKVATGKYISLGRMDGGIICSVVSVLDGTTPISLKEVFTGKDAIVVAGGSGTAPTAWSNNKFGVDFAQTQVDFVPGFANFATGEQRPMSRAENETGTGNSIGLRLFSKWIQMGSWEVTASVTRQQLQDLPLYGVDAVAKVMEACQDQITQHINWDICQHVRALGVTNAVQQKARYGFDANLWMGKNDEYLKNIAKVPMKDIYGVDHASSTSTWVVKNAEVNTSAENLHTRQRRIASRCLAAANQIAVTGRRGRANWVLTNAQVLSALQDCSGFVVAPFANNLDQTGSQNLFYGGSLNGLKIYVDPYMDWEDTRITVGRKGNVNEPGAIFMPYILADTVSITAEGTMAPKILVNSRYTIADAGFYPETQYLTFCVGSEFGII